MEQDVINEKYSREAILRDLVAILKNMTSDWDMEFSGAFGPDTRLMADLQFESIDVVQFIVAIEEHFATRNLPFEELLMKDGRYVDEIIVRNAADFLYRTLNGR